MYSGPSSDVISALVTRLVDSTFTLAHLTGRYTYISINTYYFPTMLTMAIHRSGHLMEGLFKFSTARRHCLVHSTHRNPNLMQWVKLAQTTAYVMLVGILRFVYLQIELWSSGHDATTAQEPFILSASWEDACGGTVIARHEWKGLMKMPGALEDWVEKNQQEAIDSLNNRRRSGHLQDLAQTGKGRPIRT